MDKSVVGSDLVSPTPDPYHFHGEPEFGMGTAGPITHVHEHNGVCAEHTHPMSRSKQAGQTGREETAPFSSTNGYATAKQCHVMVNTYIDPRGFENTYCPNKAEDMLTVRLGGLHGWFAWLPTCTVHATKMRKLSIDEGGYTKSLRLLEELENG